MRCFSHVPEGELAPYVSSLWLFHGQGLRHELERIVPHGGIQLLVNLEDDELRWWDGDGFRRAHHLKGAALGGPFRTPFVIDTAQQRTITGVSFRPGGAAAFFDASMHEFRDDHVSLADLGCPSIRDRLLDAWALGGAQVLSTWTAFLGERLRPFGRRVSLACAKLEAGAAIRDVTSALSISPRTLRAEFRRFVGLTPKAFARIRRMQRLLKGLADEPHPNWARWASEFGFSDQAHLTHEFRTLTGTTPTRYVARDALDWNHVVHRSDA